MGFVQSVIDWKCKPESVQGGPGEGEETMLGRGGGRGHQRRYGPTDGHWSARPRGETRQLGKLLSV